MQYRSMVIAADDFDFQDQAAIAKIIEGYIGDLNLSCSGRLSGFSWRIDVQMRYDDAS